jgi:hypothetical protein
MTSVPVPVAGSITIALFVVLGVFVYPWLLRRRLGVLAVALATAALTVLFYVFTGSDYPTLERVVFGVLCGLAPVLAGVIVFRIQKKGAKSA